MHHINYSIFNKHFLLTTNSDEMHTYLNDLLEKHIVAEKRYPPNYEIQIPLLSPEKRRYLTRTAPSEKHILKEVKISQGSTSFSSWSSTAPPLIPFNLDVIDGHYFAFHAAAINVPKFGAIILLGNKEAGKSTNSLALCEQLSWQLLSDETCVIDAYNLNVHALLRQPHGYQIDERRNLRKKVLRFIDNPWLLTASEAAPRLAFELVHIPGLAIPHVQPISDSVIATQLFLRHQLHFGGTPIAAQACSKKLALSLQTSQIHHGGYACFELIREIILSKVNRMLI
jgi:hypothetical protein